VCKKNQLNGQRSWEKAITLYHEFAVKSAQEKRGREKSSGEVRVVNSINSLVIVRPSNPGGHCHPVSTDWPCCRCLDMDG